MKHLLKSLAPPNLIGLQIPIPHSIFCCPSHESESLFALAQRFFRLLLWSDIKHYALPHRWSLPLIFQKDSFITHPDNAPIFGDVTIITGKSSASLRFIQFPPHAFTIFRVDDV